MPRTRIALSTVFVIFAACARPPQSEGVAQPSAPAEATTTTAAAPSKVGSFSGDRRGPFTPADDVAFIDFMTPHHAGAIEMAWLELDKGESPAVKKLAREMRESQTREIAEMKDTRKNLTGSEATPEKLPDAYMQAAMTKMRGMSGPALDQAFLNMMIAHHASALEVGKRAEANVRTPSLKVLAGRMFVSQLRDIDAMNELRERPPPSIDVAGDDTMVGDRRVPLTPANDLVFVDYFIAHHEHELELLKLGASRASEPAVKLIAQKTIENRTKDLERLRDLRGEVGTVEAPAAPIDRYRRQLLDRLGRATGAEFDRMFLEALAAHHGTAIAPAARAEGHLTRPELRAFARALYDIQIAEATDAYRTRESVD